MAGVEKQCEMGGEYRGSLMYTYKKNSLQVNPEKRKLFRKHKAVFFLFKPSVFVFTHGRRHAYKIGKAETVIQKTEKGGFPVWQLSGFTDKDRWEQGVPKFAYEYDYCVYVPSLQGEVDGKFFNYSSYLGIVRRKINRMFQYHLPVVKLQCCIDDEETVNYQKYYNEIYE